MRNLPGFYYDHERKRYFPESSRSNSRSQSERSSVHHGPSSKYRGRGLIKKPQREGNINATIIRMQKNCRRIPRQNLERSLAAQQIIASSSSCFIRVQNMGFSPFSALHVSEQSQGEQRTVYLGDQTGQCFATANSLILPELHLTSQITSIQASKDIAIFTSFGPYPQIMVRNAESLESFILRPRQLQDARTSRLLNSSLTLGMQKKALHIPNLDDPREIDSLHTDSDVFALHRSNHEVWTGTRNGSITLFDLRSKQRIPILSEDPGYGSHNRSTVTNLSQIGGFHLLVARMSGEIKLFDMRVLPRPERHNPVQAFRGHVNSYSNNLALTIDPDEEYLFAAGEDKRVRIWSIRSGNMLEPPFKTGWQGLVTRVFDHPVLAMQVTNKDNMKKLWLCSGSKFEYYDLFKHGQPEPGHRFIS